MNISNIDLNLLVVLEALLIHRNVTKAAEMVGLSQPAMSNALSRLRVVFGDPLLVRGSGGMVATPRALELEKPLRHALESVRSALSPPRAFSPATSNQVFTVACTDYVEQVLAPSLCHKLAEQAPGIKLEIRPLSERIPQRDLERAEIDLAIGYFTDAPGNLYVQKIYDENFVCVARRGHPLMIKTLTLKRYTELKHIIVSPWGGMVGLVDIALEQEGIKREVCLSTAHFSVAPFIVALTDYVVTLPRRIASEIAPLLDLELFELPLKLPVFTIAQIWHERTHKDPACHWLREMILELGSRSVSKRTGR